MTPILTTRTRALVTAALTTVVVLGSAAIAAGPAAAANCSVSKWKTATESYAYNTANNGCQAIQVRIARYVGGSAVIETTFGPVHGWESYATSSSGTANAGNAFHTLPNGINPTWNAWAAI